MQISIRSQLIAGTAAVVGASAIAMTPVTQANLALPDLQLPSAAQVALAGFDSPISELITSIGLANAFLFDTAGPLPNPAPWSSLAAIGLLPQIIDDGLPIISQLGVNGSDYLYQTGKGLGTSAYLLSEGTWNAFGDLLTLDIPGAITTLTNAVTAAGEEALATGQYVLTGVVTRAAAVATALAALTPEIATAVVNQGLVVAGSVVQVLQNAVAALSSANPIENTWNAVVDGLFGPTGIPGALTAITVGPGVLAPAPISAFVPSVRTVVSTVVNDVQTALSTANPAPPPAAAQSAAASASAVPSASALRAAAAQEPSAADEGGATAGSGSPAGDNSTAAAGKSSGSQAKSESGKAGSKRGVGGSKRAAATSGD
ncbi:hypothetical protein ORI20_27895 [Mycobacterium sp. CVI_P3]|uniref:PE-PGRS family protein n=1 Tax=Mycobacterium pinniadriaticum TaxID=2994102 RepID=A0ABT3SLW1_9MYCO|nr:hypothetical protein [Mycobacterium pinniadriaticum]MCX2934096.1 hypothetical protein [Mycobacterium pinniadriaticum]MCX2940518.1 hypothetical protein [Mycobacterium pinniadriaticum]